ncbi:MAG: hypothetical protein AB7O28_08065 [Vicinamibacterales bacterium]
MRIAKSAGMTLAAVLAATAAQADVKGKVSLKGASFTVADAVAYKADDGVEVAFLPAAFDRKAAARDSKIDSFDVMRMGTAHVTLRIDADGSFNCIDYSTGQGGGSSCNSDYTKGLALTARTADRVAGTFRLKNGGDTADVTFDLKVESAAARSGTALPADGGDPGKAALAHFAAIEKNDLNALIATAPPEEQEMMRASVKSGEAKEMFQMMRAMTPRKIKLLGGTVDGDEALVDFEGVADGKPVKGVATVVRLGGKWYLKGTSMQ